MRPFLNPKLINTPYDDPALFIPFLFEKRAFIFDLGDIYALSSRDILKVTHIFITHTHMDHFIGFDRLLRFFLGREKHLYFYGPQGLIDNVEGKLSGYAWNLVENYPNRFIIHLNEVHPEQIVSKRYQCQNRFLPDHDVIKQPFTGTLYAEPGLSVSAVILDHSISCLGLSIKERFHINIKKEAVLSLDLEIGPWLKRFKDAIYRQTDPDSVFEIRLERTNATTKRFVLGNLADKIIRITPGQKITYITDVLFSRENVDKMVSFSKASDHLFIEAAFLEMHKDIAKDKYHLTAQQAGIIAGKAGVKQFTLFHFSPRYTGMESLIQKEATTAYEKVKYQTIKTKGGHDAT